MAIGSGLSAQYGMKRETTYGTAVVVDRFLDIISSDIATTIGEIETELLGQQYLTTGGARSYAKGAEGNVELPVMTKGMGVLFEQVFGNGTSAQVGSTTEYKQTYTPASTNGPSATVQLGKPAVSGTVHPFTYAGGKVTGWEFAMEIDGALTLTVDWVFASVTTGTALASPSYSAGRTQFTWDKATLTWGGTAVCVRQFSIKGERALDTERYCLGSTARKEPILNGISSVTIDAEGEFAGLDLYNDFVAGTQKALVITALGDTIPAESNPYKVVFTIAAAKLTDAAEPTIDGPEILTQPATFKALSNGTDPVITLEYHTTDTAI